MIQKARWGSRTCLLMMLAVLGVFYLVLRGLGAFLITGDPLEKADVVVALGGGGEWRVVEAVRLITKEHLASGLVLTEPGEDQPGAAPGSRLFRIAAIESGLSPYAIQITEGVQHNTQDEAQAVLALMKKHQYQSVIVVTDPYHTFRARLIFHDTFRGSGLKILVHPVPEPWYRSDNWFLSADGWANTLREYIKLFGYLLKRA